MSTTEKGSMEVWRDNIERLRSKFRRQFKIGDEWKKPGAEIETHDIDVSYFDPSGYDYRKPDEVPQKWHGAMIQVHGDRELRDRIAAWLATESNA